MSSLAHDETGRKRFWREARAAASVNHPNVCHIYEIGDHDGELFIAMELLEGEALAERLRRGPPSLSAAGPIGPRGPAPPPAVHARGNGPPDPKPATPFVTPPPAKRLRFPPARAPPPP